MLKITKCKLWLHKNFLLQFTVHKGAYKNVRVNCSSFYLANVSKNFMEALFGFLKKKKYIYKNYKTYIKSWSAFVKTSLNHQNSAQFVFVIIATCKQLHAKKLLKSYFSSHTVWIGLFSENKNLLPWILF